MEHIKLCSLPYGAIVYVGKIKEPTKTTRINKIVAWCTLLA